MTAIKYAIVSRDYVNRATGYVTNEVLCLGKMSYEDAVTIHYAVGGELCEVIESLPYQADRPMGGGYEKAWVRDTLYRSVDNGTIVHTRLG